MTKINNIKINNNNKKEEEQKMRNVKFWEQEAKEAKRALRVINLQIGGSSKMADLRLLEQRNGELAWMLNEAGNKEEAEIYLRRAEYYKKLQEEAKGKNIEEAKDKNIEEAKDKKEEESKMTKINNNNKKEEESKMMKECTEKYDRIVKAEEEILIEIEALEDNIADTEAQGYDPLEETEIKKEDISYALETISTILLLEDLTEGDLLKDVRSKISDVRRREEEVDLDLAHWREEYGLYYTGPARHKASPYELR